VTRLAGNWELETLFGRRASGNLLAGSWELAAGSGKREACSLLRVLPLNLHHTAIAVRDLDAALAEFKRLYGVAPITREKVEDQGVEEAMVPLGGSFIQLLMPLGDDTPVGRFVTKRGEGMHHIAFQVADIDAALSHLAGEGVELIDAEPRLGGDGNRIAFVHPGAFSATLIELVEVG